mmetsp:Transcript_14097/g.35630  ORF Transcript_14097/g.35630 Transcript_14097/m.35630 type:complete len:216 (-) Transcript_14097:55-702(-)|eukprot:CAMPEP_0198234382 /NCGR_PEP_ID=MMETSP1446-20131203/416_1 /TAXON_ID=1461542 ORGANISM="Unidentified sp, Strain CCMP2111" /NCGR_SAMPLE_ID=MMETSP1446 /ASSEMBLY_ACC=CAM_ASM_001112 /LENGTH=215 /DNA_ID=CAMNT_0043915155 /DNA_START=191 /DNA_END=838 /DNA_ORIENTATION=+
MDEREVQVQINQMVQFIKKEAEEKANEIRAAAQEEYTIQKQTMVEAEKAKIRKEYERKRSQIDSRKAIEKSTQLNTARLRFLQAQQDAVQQAIDSARDRLPQITQSAQEYRNIIAGLLFQALQKFGSEMALNIRCFQRDLSIVQESIEPARRRYNESSGKAAPAVSVDSGNWLTQGVGGIVVSTSDGKITCANTLESRLDLVARQVLPEVRKMLF